MRTKIPRSLAHDIQQNIDNGKGLTEVECKIRFPDPHDSKHYDIAMKYMDGKKSWKRSVSHTVDIFRNQKRFTKIDDKYFNTSKTTPSVLQVVDYDDFSLKFTVCKENMKETKEPKSYDFIRVKDRTSFSKGNVRIDLTQVTQDEMDDCFEIEIEVIHPERFNYGEFIDTIFMIVDTQIDPRKSINSFFNKMLGGSHRDDQHLNWNLTARPRDLKIEDMTNDGLLDNYVVMVKADGVMKFLIFHQSGIWLVGFSQDYDDSYEFVCPLPGGMGPNTGSIYQGELIGNDFYLFDCCAHYSSSKTEQHYLNRVRHFEHVSGKRFGKYNILEVKRFPYSQKKVQFFNQIREAFKESKRMGYQTDGLIFRPNYCPYLPSGVSQRKEDRVLSKHRDICKWKPSHLQTIDFKVVDGGLYVNDGTLFTGTKQYPFTRENYTLEGLETPEKLEGQIVEFKPQPKGNTFFYTPVRIRKDKTNPNSLQVALDGWELVRNPITKDMLCGKSTRLLECYLQKVRSSIISKSDHHLPSLHIFPMHQHLSEDPVRENVTVMDKNISHLNCDHPLKIINSWDELEPHKELIVHYLHPTTNIGLEKGIEKIKASTDKLTINFLCLSGRKMRSMFSSSGKELHFNDLHIRRDDSTGYTVTSPSGERKFKMADYFELNSLRGGGKSKEDYILTKTERDLLQLYVFGQYKTFGDSHQKSAPVKRLPVDISKGSRREGGFTALGDDKMEQLEGDLFRLAVIDQGSSLQHSFLKLLNSEYRAAPLSKRLEMADEVKLRSDLSKTSKDINHGILVKSESDVRYGDGKRWIIIFEHSDGSYEPVVHKDGAKINMVFSRDSSLIQS